MRIFFIIFFIIYPYYLNSKVINLKYEIDWKSIHLADLFWKIKIEDNLYEIDFTIKSYGMTDKIYGYESITKVSGEIKDDSFNPMIYKSKTKSSKQDRFENIIFNKNGTISNIEISKELSSDQINLQNTLINDYKFFTDPISQLVQYFIFQTDSKRLIIDGINIYELSSITKNTENLKSNNPSIYKGNAEVIDLVFPFFKGLYKENKKNNLEVITVYSFEKEIIKIPAKFRINSKKFKANLHLKEYEILQ